MATRWKFEGTNPIVGYTVGFEIAGILSPDALLQISALGPSLAKDLPRKVDQQAVTFQMGSSSPIPVRSIGGVVFDELARDGTVLKQLVVTPNSVTYRTARYERWLEYWPTAERLLNQIADVVLRHAGISGFVINAANKFTLTGDQSSLPFDELIRPGCEFIAPNLLGKKGPCHCFYGFMIESSDPPGRRIDNVNFSVGAKPENVESNWVDLIINLRLVLNNPITERGPLFGKGVDALPHRPASDVLERMHAANNDLFAGILTKDLCDIIPGISPL